MLQPTTVVAGKPASSALVDADGVLLRRYRTRGDRDAFEALFRKYQGPVYGLVVRLVGTEEAYDLTQDVFLRVLRSVHSFRGDCMFRTWLYTIARHVCYNHCRDKSRRAQVEEISAGDDAGDGSDRSEVPDKHMDVARIVETQELQRLVASVLDAMPVEQRLLITLRDFEGLSYEEIVQITDLSLVNVKSKLHRARLAFKLKFEPYWKDLDHGENELRGNGAAHTQDIGLAGALESCQNDCTEQERR